MAPFLASLASDDLAPATLRGYRYDLRHFLAWHRTVQDRPFSLEGAFVATWALIGLTRRRKPDCANGYARGLLRAAPPPSF